MTPELQAILSGLIVTLGTAFGAWLSYRINSRKTTASTLELIEKTSGNLVKRMEARMEALEKKLILAEQEIEQKEKCNGVLEERISALVIENEAKDIKIAALEGRVAELESELAKFKNRKRRTHGTT